MKKSIILITACGNKKEDKPMEAGKLYKSSRIRHLYKRSKELDIPFYILSAKYGLVCSDEVIYPYNAVMTEEKCNELKKQIEEVLKKYDKVIYYRGGARKEYYNCIESISKKLKKEFVSFGYGNMGDIGRLEEIINGFSITTSNF